MAKKSKENKPNMHPKNIKEAIQKYDKAINNPDADAADLMAAIQAVEEMKKEI